MPASAALLMSLCALTAAAAVTDVSTKAPVAGGCREEGFYASAALCATMADARVMYGKLTAAARFDAAAIPKLRFMLDEDELGGGFFPESREVRIPAGNLRLAAESPHSLLYVMAHELGHGVQVREDYLVDKDSVNLKTFESQADTLGLEIALKAGYPSDAYLDGAHRLFGRACADPSTAADQDNDHPNMAVRAANLALFRRYMESGAVPKDADPQKLDRLYSGAGEKARFGTTVPLQAFDRTTGALPASRLIPAAVKDRFVAAARADGVPPPAANAESLPLANVLALERRLKSDYGDRLPPRRQRAVNDALRHAVDTALDSMGGGIEMTESLLHACELPAPDGPGMSASLARYSRLLAGDVDLFLARLRAPKA